MVKKINKRVAFGLSLLFSSVIGLFVASEKAGTVDLHSLALGNPLTNVEKVYADGDCGDCSGCACDSAGSVEFPPAVGGIVVGATIVQ